jgi:hypothetical protein
VIRRPFPPDHQAAITKTALAEMLERLNPHRRMRTCPRVIKRARHNSYRVKRPTDISITHPRPPTIKLDGIPAAA